MTSATISSALFPRSSGELWSELTGTGLDAGGVSILFWAIGLTTVSCVAVILWLRGQSEELRRRRAREAWLHAAQWPENGFDQGLPESLDTAEREREDPDLSMVPALEIGPEPIKPSALDVTRAGDILDVLGGFAAGIAADFSDQLTTILGHAELMKQRAGDDPELKASLADIQSAAEAGRRATKQLMAFGGGGVRRGGAHSLADLVHSASNHATARAGGLIRQHISPCASSVEGNLEELTDALEALLVNALEASRGKVVTLRCEATQSDTADDPDESLVRISILDSGRGLPPGSEHQLFQPGFSTKPGGRGMGLPVAMTMAARNGGRIVLRDAREAGSPQSGTLAELYLRRATLHTKEVLMPLAASRHGKGETVVMLVEDEDSVLRLERRLLEREGYRVLTASSGESALDVVRANPGTIDVLVTDVTLPGIDGVELAERMVELLPGTPVVYVSGMFQGDELRSQLLGTTPHFIQKPFSTEEFFTTISAALANVTPGGRKRVLVVDDESTTQRLVRSIVEGNNFDCVVAQDGRAALELLDQAHFDLVITDIVMPILDGVDLCRTITKRYPGVHIIAMSGNRSGRRGLQAATTFGAELVLSKPFSHDEMSLAIHDLLDDVTGDGGTVGKQAA